MWRTLIWRCNGCLLFTDKEILYKSCFIDVNLSSEKKKCRDDNKILICQICASCLLLQESAFIHLYFRSKQLVHNSFLKMNKDVSWSHGCLLLMEVLTEQSGRHTSADCYRATNEWIYSQWTSILFTVITCGPQIEANVLVKWIRATLALEVYFSRAWTRLWLHCFAVYN